MQMASRIRSAWEKLGEELQGTALGEARFFERLGGWLRDELAGTSMKAEEAMREAAGIRRMREADPATLPISTAAAAAFQGALREEPPKDPVQLVELVNRLCWNLVVFRHPDACCPRCQGDLEQWTDGTAAFERCDVLGCCFDERGALLAEEPEHLRPARRDEVLRRFPDAALV